MRAVVTHGRHCPCSACAREDWTNPQLGPCGMHGPDCPRVYAPMTPPTNPEPATELPRWRVAFEQWSGGHAGYAEMSAFAAGWDAARAEALAEVRRGVEELDCPLSYSTPMMHGWRLMKAAVLHLLADPAK